MNEYPEIAARFASETDRHEMTVLHDQGLYRHLRFSAREFGSYWFDLITVPGALIFQGDGNSYVFRRLDDMFVFFRSGIWKDGTLHINPGYWSEKLNSDRHGVMTYSMDVFNRHVDEALKEGEKQYPGVTKAWRDLVDNCFNVEHEEDARAALAEFEFSGVYESYCSCGASAEFTDYREALAWQKRHLASVPDDGKHRVLSTPKPFRFDDYEWDLTDYHWWFLWACHGIVWGIQQYDAWRLTVPAHRPDMPTTYEYGGQTWDLTKSYYDDCGEVWEHRGWWLGDVPLMWSVDSNGKPLHDPVPFGDAWRGDLQVWRSKP